MNRYVKRGLERGFCSVVLFVLAPVAMLIILACAFVVLIPGTPLKVTYRGDGNDED